MRMMLLLLLGLGVSVCEAAEWLSYCTTDEGEKVREESSKKWYKKVEHSGGHFVTLTTKKRLKHVQLSCTSTVEPICAVQAGENPVVSDKPQGEWTYHISGNVHSRGVFCAYFWAQT